MNVQEIFDEVLLLIDHNLTDVQLVKKLNQLSRQLFREFPVPDKIYKFTMNDTSFGYYDLPADCAEDRIRVAIVNEIEYEKLTPEIQSVSGPFCMVILEKLFISPNVPENDVYLYYGPRHVTLSATDLTAVPTFPEDYHGMLVYDLAKWIASIQRDVDMVNNFQREYDEIETKARKGLKKMGLKRVKETTIW